MLTLHRVPLERRMNSALVHRASYQQGLSSQTHNITYTRHLFPCTFESGFRPGFRDLLEQ